jgi:ADP-ribosylglycohydrolase
MKELRDKMIYSAFIGDALSLGVHWIYSSEEISGNHGKVKEYIDPSGSRYHSSKKKGDQTHYGDQMMVLLESIVGNRGFDPEKFSTEWQNFFKEYNGYFDGATKTTLANLKLGDLYTDAGSDSNDLSGAARIAPLVYLYHDDEEALVRYAREQTALTHRDHLVIDAAAFFAEAAALVLKGAHPVEAIEKTSRNKFSDSIISEWVDMGINKAARESVEAINRFGLTCHIDHAFPGVIQVIAKYHNNLAEGISQCISAGGDNAARAIVAGMILGAYPGSGDIPEGWFKGLNYGERINTLISSLK